MKRIIMKYEGKIYGKVVDKYIPLDTNHIEKEKSRYLIDVLERELEKQHDYHKIQLLKVIIFNENEKLTKY
jgi:hypothetical protein